MTNVSIKIKDGHKLNGDGEFLGKDLEGTNYTFWKNMGHMQVPIDLAIKLERETPQRYEMVNRELANKALSDYNDSNSSKDEENIEILEDFDKEEVEKTLKRIEKIISYNKAKQVKILKKNKDNPDEYPKEMDRVKRIILQRYDI